MKPTNPKDGILTVKKSHDMDYKQSICEYVRKACRIVSDSIEDYIPDKVYADCPGEIVVRLPLGGVATIEVSTDTFLLRE